MGHIFAHDLAGIVKTCTTKSKMFIFDSFTNVNALFNQFCLKIGTHIVCDSVKVPAKGFPSTLLLCGDMWEFRVAPRRSNAVQISLARTLELL